MVTNLIGSIFIVNFLMEFLDGGDYLRERAAKSLNNGIARDAEIVAGTSGDISDDDRPLSAWFEGAHSPPTADGRKLDGFIAIPFMLNFRFNVTSAC